MSEQFMKPSGFNHDYPTARGYSYLTRSGDTVFTSGQVARDEEGEIVGKGDVVAQARKVYENLRSLMEQAGGSLADVICTRTSITQRDHKFAIRPITKEFFPGPNFPTGAMYIVAGLSDPDYLIEVEAIAHIPIAKAE
jgi:2-iminobutanoate/2-iminopropanoate deaminase